MVHVGNAYEYAKGSGKFIKPDVPPGEGVKGYWYYPNAFEGSCFLEFDVGPFYLPYLVSADAVLSAADDRIQWIFPSYIHDGLTYQQRYEIDVVTTIGEQTARIVVLLDGTDTWVSADTQPAPVLFIPSPLVLYLIATGEPVGYIDSFQNAVLR